MKVFVTGGTGFLGREVIHTLLERKIAVRAMVRTPPRPAFPEGVETVVAGFDDASGMPLAEAIDGVDAVLHLAGKVSRDPDDASDMHWIHVEATKKLLAAMTVAKVKKLVLASTSGTIAVSKKPRTATELDDAQLEVIGRWPYYVSKRLQEQEVRRWDAQDKIEAVILNPSLLLGPGDDRMSSVGDVHKILHGRLPAITDGTMAIVDVRDAATAFVTALQKGRRGERYLLNGSNISVRSFVDRVARAGGVSAPLLKLPEKWAVFGAKMMEGLAHAVDRLPPIDAVSVEMSCHHWGCSSAKAERELGFTARDPQETIADTVRDLERRGRFKRRR